MRKLGLTSVALCIVWSSNTFAQSHETYTWDGRQDFSAGYFDVFFENGYFVALPSVYSNNLEGLLINNPNANNCIRSNVSVEKSPEFNALIKMNIRLVRSQGLEAPIYKNDSNLGMLKDVEINGLTNWSYPDLESVIGSEKIKYFQRALCHGGSGEAYGARVATYNKKKVIYSDEKFYNRNGYWTSTKNVVDPALLILTRKATISERQAFADKFRTIDKIKGIAAQSVNGSTLITTNTPPLPTLLHATSAPNLTKDEFETTVMFESRKKTAQEKWEAEVRKIEVENQRLQSEYEVKVSNAEREYQSQLQIVSSDSYRQKLYREGFNKGIKLVLGKPYFRDIVYDADNQKMSATVFSAQDETFSRSLSFDVPLSTARSFKADLQNKNIVPVITFDENLNVISAKTLSNTGLIDLDFQQAKESASVEQLEDFIKKHPQSTKVGLARSEIAKLKSEEARRQAEREAKRREAEALAKKRAEEKARQDAYDYEHACKNYYVGYVGEWERTGWLATGEKFVVRYTNPERKSVTIEATESGNSLSYGENKELSCFDLLQGERRARD